MTQPTSPSVNASPASSRAPTHDFEVIVDRYSFDVGRSQVPSPSRLIPALPSPTPDRTVSNDNPYSEAQLKTLKYRPDFPTRFASIEAARRHCKCQTFFGWYNDEHRHTGLGLHVPADVHYGRAPRPLSLIHISEPTRLLSISYAVFCLKKKKKQTLKQSTATPF